MITVKYPIALIVTFLLKLNGDLFAHLFTGLEFASIQSHPRTQGAPEFAGDLVHLVGGDSAPGGLRGEAWCRCAEQ